MFEALCRHTVDSGLSLLLEEEGRCNQVLLSFNNNVPVQYSLCEILLDTFLKQLQNRCFGS